MTAQEKFAAAVLGRVLAKFIPKAIPPLKKYPTGVSISPADIQKMFNKFDSKHNLVQPRMQVAGSAEALKPLERRYKL